jgi:hypothetical protein
VKNGSLEHFPQDSDLSFPHLGVAVLEIAFRACHELATIHGVMPL